MATFKAEIQNKRADGTYNVRIRVTHNRQIRRISTNIYVTAEDLTRSLKIKSRDITDKSDALISQCYKLCNDIGYTINSMSIDELVDRLKNELKGGDRFKLDFIKYAYSKIESMKPGTAGIYKSSINALCRFIKRDHLDISEINLSFLQGFEKFIETEPSRQGSNRKKDNKTIKTKGGRAVSAYPSCIRAIHNLAKTEYNDEDRGYVPIPYSPFKNYKIKPEPRPKKRAVSIKTIQDIINLPYEVEKVGGKWNRHNLAKDCFIISFVLMGMNSADMYHAEKPDDGVIKYNRQKTQSRRDDKAEMWVKAEQCIARLLEKY